jgi:O-antigen/teichoic acid export membrane protein
MRTNNVIKNIFGSGGNIVIIMILTFLYRTIFIQKFGLEYLGLTALYVNILLVLSLAEAGLGQAISYSLYKPLANGNSNTLAVLLNLFKKAYVYIGLIVLLSGLVLLPFLQSLINKAEPLMYMHHIFILMLLSTLVTYFMTYKRVLIIADQKYYKIITRMNIFSTIDLLGKSAILLYFPLVEGILIALSYQVVIKIIESYLINRYITLQYSEVFNLNVNEIEVPRKERMEVVANVKALIFHKIGDCLVNGTDNIIISKFISLTLLGVASNYFLIITTGMSILVVSFNSFVSGLGNLIAVGDRDKVRNVCESINLLGYFFFGFGALFIYYFSNPFVYIWLGPDMLLDETTIFLLAVNFFLLGLRVTLNVIKSGAGIYVQDKYSPLIQAFVNLFFSLLLVQEFQLNGVLLGTLISSVLVPFWNRPYVIYKYLFDESPWGYFVGLFKFLLVIFILILVINNIVNVDFLYVRTGLGFLYTNIIFLFTYVFVFIVFYHKNKSFGYIINKISFVSRRNVNEN